MYVLFYFPKKLHFYCSLILSQGVCTLAKHLITCFLLLLSLLQLILSHLTHINFHFNLFNITLSFDAFFSQQKAPPTSILNLVITVTMGIKYLHFTIYKLVNVLFVLSELLIWTKQQMKLRCCQSRVEMDYTDGWRRKTPIEFHVLCPGRKHIVLIISILWMLPMIYVNKSCLLTSMLQSSRSSAEFWFIASSFTSVCWFLRCTSRNVRRQHKRAFFDVLIYTMSVFMIDIVRYNTRPVHHIEDDGDDDSSQHRQSNSQTYRQHPCRHRAVCTLS